MPLAIRCPNGHKLKVPSKYAGKSVNCPACKSSFEVPANGTSKEPAKEPRTKETSRIKPPPVKRRQPNSKHTVAKQKVGKKQTEEPALPVPSKKKTSQEAPVSEKIDPPSPVATEDNSPPPLSSEGIGSPTVDSSASEIATTSVPEAEIIPPVNQPNRLLAFLLERNFIGTELGYRPDRIHRTSIYWLASGQALLACFTAIPAFWQMGAEQVAPWIYLVLMLAFLQGAYAAWLCLSPDYSSAQVAMFASGLIAAIYAAATAVCWLTEARTGGWFHLGSLKMIHGNKPALWCAAVMLLASLVAYFCGHISYRWQKTYQRLWSAKSS